MADKRDLTAGPTWQKLIQLAGPMVFGPMPAFGIEGAAIGTLIAWLVTVFYAIAAANALAGVAVGSFALFWLSHHSAEEPATA